MENSILLFIIPCWIINSMLNLLYPARRRFNLIRQLDIPLDQNKMLGPTRILGDSTTILGFFVAILTGGCIELLFPFIPGLIMGLGMYMGHAFGSFIKRRMRYTRGRFLPFIDHGDGIIVTGALLLMYGYISIPIYVISIGITLIVYPIICYTAYKLSLRERPL